MESTFSGIELGKRGLMVSSKRLGTVGHNISNMDTEGYSRQRVEVAAFRPLYRPGLNRAHRPGQIGQGVESMRVRRIRDELLDNRIVDTQSSTTYWSSRSKYILMMERVYNEPGETSIRALADQFWDSWQELSTYPEQVSARYSVRQRGAALAEGIKLRAEGLEQIRVMLDDDIRVNVEELNRYINDIGTLNREIVQVEAEGDNPNDLLDRRDLLVEKLAGIVDISVDRRDPDEFSIYTGGYHIVQGGTAREFTLRGSTATYGAPQLVWNHSGEEVELFGGKLAALFGLRDVDLRGEQAGLDQMTVSFMHMVNEIHRDAYGLNGERGNEFFVEYPQVLNSLGNYDSNGDGTVDVSYIFRISGSNTLHAQEQVGLEGTMSLSGSEGIVEIDYFPEDTINDIIERINQSEAEIVARLNRNGFLELRATPAAQRDNPDFVIRSLEDSGQFLVGYTGILQDTGPVGSYNWNQPSAVLGLSENADYGLAPLRSPSNWIAVNDAINDDITSLAAAFSPINEETSVGDGSAAMAIADLQSKELIIGKTAKTFNDYFADVIASIGVRGEEADIALKTRELVLKDLSDSRAAISGVNLDEEVTQMIKFQHGYQAMARFISQYDQLLDTIINRMGV